MQTFDFTGGRLVAHCGCKGVLHDTWRAALAPPWLQPHACLPSSGVQFTFRPSHISRPGLSPSAAHVLWHVACYDVFSIGTEPVPAGPDLDLLFLLIQKQTQHPTSNIQIPAGLDFDLALRLFMDAFRPPGEGQKIDRIMQVGAWPGPCLCLVWAGLQRCKGMLHPPGRKIDCIM